MNKKSSRHHYIPQFLIKAFYNAENTVYVYDIENDRILTKPKSSKSVLFEWDRNTFIDIYGEENSIIEDLLFQEWDNNASNVVRKFQTTKLPDQTLLSTNNVADFVLFIIQLFWRIPYTDFAFENLIQNADIDSKNADELKKSEAFKMHQRTLLYKETTNNVTKVKRKFKGFYAKIFELEKDIFIIGDNPILYQEIPSTFEDLYDLDSMVALSPKRIFTNSLTEIESFGFNKALEYNHFIISQSKRFVCSGDKTLLEESVKYHKKVKDLFIDEHLKKQLFSDK